MCETLQLVLLLQDCVTASCGATKGYFCLLNYCCCCCCCCCTWWGGRPNLAYAAGAAVRGCCTRVRLTRTRKRSFHGKLLALHGC